MRFLGKGKNPPVWRFFSSIIKFFWGFVPACAGMTKFLIFHKKRAVQKVSLYAGGARGGVVKKSINWGAGPICIAGKVGIRNAISKPSRPVDGICPHRHTRGYSTA